MRDLYRSTLLIAVVLLVPIVPFIGFGATINEWFQRWAENPPAPGVTTAVIVGLLATDIFLPIPSSVVSVVGGAELSTVGGTLASFVGMSLGAALGFGLARSWGRPLAIRFAKTSDLDRTATLVEGYGPLVLAVTRAVPVLAEASVLLVGVHRMSWRRFLPPVLLANLCVSLVYSVVGAVAREHDSMSTALAVSIALPPLLWTIVRWWVPR